MKKTAFGKIPDNIEDNLFQLFDWRDATRSQKMQLYKQYKKTADRRLRRLREAGMNIPIETRDYLDAVGRRNFPSIFEKDSEWKLNNALDEVTSFLDNERSTLTGLRKILNEVKQRIEDRINIHRDEEYQLNLSNLNEREFYNFLHSKQFKGLRNKIDSDLLVEDYENAVSEGYTMDEIMKHYEEFLSSEISFSEMKERRSAISGKNKD